MNIKVSSPLQKYFYLSLVNVKICMFFNNNVISYNYINLFVSIIYVIKSIFICIYKSMSQYYYNIIVYTINCIVDDLQKKWKNVKDYYKKEKKELPSGSAAAKKKKYVYFEMLGFLDKTIERRR